MPRFYFDTDNGECLVRDAEGVVLADRETARSEAHTALGQMSKDCARVRDRRSLFVNVRTETGAPVYTVSMSVTGSWLD